MNGISTIKKCSAVSLYCVSINFLGLFLYCILSHATLIFLPEWANRKGNIQKEKEEEEEMLWLMKFYGILPIYWRIFQIKFQEKKNKTKRKSKSVWMTTS